MTAPTHLRVEHLDEPLGIGTPRPRLSWWLPAGSSRQLAYRIQADGWDSGAVGSAASVLVPYEGPLPRSGQRVTWRVKVWTDTGESGWSRPSWWEPGLLEPDDWTAAWISPADPRAAAPGERPAYLLRTEFALDKPVVRARAHATARGLYELHCNGSRVSDLELLPGFTSYRTRLQVQTFDVTPLLRQGPGVLGAVLSDGWYRGRHGFLRLPDQWGEEVALLVQLVVDHPGGSRTVIGTGPDWRWATGAIVSADLMDGQRVDLREDLPGWSRPGPCGGVWSDVALAEPEQARLVASPGPPVRAVETLRPVAVTTVRPGVQVIDLGQNINGRLRLTGLGPAGTTLTLTHGEALTPDGDVTTENLRAFDFATRAPLPAGQTDRVTAAGLDGETFEPRHTTHGFRYARVEGHPDGLAPGDVAGVVVHTDLRRTGWFRCADERLNQLHEAAVWSFRGNACDIPTDCPQRERAGWTGDYQLFAPAAAFVFDVAGFTWKWLRDVAAEQWPDGRVPNYSPGQPPFLLSPAEAGMTGSAGWGDAMVNVPWEMWRAYGDRDLLAEFYPAMLRWVDFGATRAREHGHPGRAPGPHDRYLWDTGFHWGEWLQPDGPQHPEPDRDHSVVATAYLHRSARLVAGIARLLGHQGDAARMDELAAGTLMAWRHAFVRPDGGLAVDDQATHVRSLAFDLVPPAHRALAAARLAELVRRAGTHLTTGFLATPHLLPVLADNGHLDVAYELLLRDTAPSWLHMIEQGATTIWEHWEAVGGDGTVRGSLNHYSKGAVISFLHTHVAGIRPLEPGYRHFAVAPRPGGGLSWAEAELHSPYGRILSSWRVTGDELELRIEVPPGTTADVRLPGAEGHATTAPGTHTYRTRL
ncbi:family 78 glycoside hydrolase catalytic domain [Nonomuraea zeae]|uniref:alpha-L-rhamnosidase n=1 Tax=Nonomuraea zeae TaxID=1642303 RepID=A0A5S4HGY8_9ACTN|nr:family 78 glycoside hydrolase catalytic domain [Nonomuraea zeae]TMR38240.1 alpha-L-rhamnosidase [Nonomuraea zeae]